MTDRHLLVLTTCGNNEDADRLARTLVGERLAACVNVVERVVSTYRWQDEVRQEPECLLVIKTTSARYPELEQALRSGSSYELPEVLAIDIAAGSAPYLAWVGASVGPPPGRSSS